MSVEANGIESRWGPPDLDQPGRRLRLLLGPASWMSQDTLQLVGILDDGDHLHVRAALPLVVRSAHCSRLHPGRPCYVLRQAFLGGLVEDANAVIYAETGMLPGQKVSGKVFIE